VPRPAHDFEASYQAETVPPWEIGRPQAPFVAVAERGGLTGRVLDAGCGTGEHALMAAALGHPALGVDFAATAISIARDKARSRGLDARFVVGDALELHSLGERFDTVLDCGLFHTFDTDDRAAYVESLASVVEPGGRCHVLCFSDAQPGDWGPNRITRTELESAFATGWHVDAIEATTLAVTITDEPIQSWLATVTRT
jgi:ubiquinone/menaquinone biosynthesis C-methylase UbiE